MAIEPDQIALHHAPFCPCWAKVFGPADVPATSQKRQAFDIPRPRLEVAEHRLGLIAYCGQTHPGGFPETVNYPVQYGSRASGYRYLGNVYFYLSEFRRYTTIPIDLRSGDSPIMLISANGGRASRLAMNLRQSRYFLVYYSRELDTLAASPSESYVTCQ